MLFHYKNTPVFYQEEGIGSPIVLLHGFLENSSMWNSIKPILSESHRVISIDLLGHGQTGCLGYIHTMNDMADAVLMVLKHLHIDRYTLIGHSMGGYVALALAEKNPSAVLGLCLMNSTYHADDKERVALRQRANVMIKDNFDAMIRMSFTHLFSPKRKRSCLNDYETALNQALQTPLQGYIAAQKGMMVRPNTLEFLKGLKAKKLIIIAKEDPVIDGESILKETQGTDISCEQLAYGHMSHIENLKELTYIIKRFIE